MTDNSITTYQRILKSSIAEQILADCKIYVDVDTLRPHLIGDRVSKGSEVYKYMKNASQGGGFVSTKYHSKDIITARMFTCKNHLNVITLSDPVVLSAMKSRYDRGVMAVLDYKAYEPSIIRHILGNSFPENFHTWAAQILCLDRSDVKRVNMALLYCEDFEARAVHTVDDLVGMGCDPNHIVSYICHMEDIRNKIDEFVGPHIKTYQKYGYIVNSFGRKIYPKESRNIFSNMIQSIGSEIIVDAIIDTNEFLSGKKSHLLFHKFDSLYFDISRGDFSKNIDAIVKIMESIGGEIQLKVGIQLGNSLNSLKDFKIE